jgi:TATA-box binding protein (TBP) (component of TFIID and TFIIIB)
MRDSVMRVVNSTIACCSEPQVTVNLQKLPAATTYTRFPGAKVRFGNFTVMFFESGKMNLLGLKDISLLDACLAQVATYMCKAGYNVTVKGHLKNIVVTTKFPAPVNLPDAYGKLREHRYKCMLELELYPAIRVWSTWTALVYHTGQVIVTGLKTIEQGTDAVDSLTKCIQC